MPTKGKDEKGYRTHTEWIFGNDKDKNLDGKENYEILHARGEGHYVGFLLNVVNCDPSAGWDKEKQPWLATLDDGEAFNKNVKLLHISFGEEENRTGILNQLTDYLDERGINYVARTYPGAHEWENWRAAAADFYQMVFKW